MFFALYDIKLTNSQTKHLSMKKVWELIAFIPLVRLLALPLSRMKTIAHTKGYADSHQGLYTPIM